MRMSSVFQTFPSLMYRARVLRLVWRLDSPTLFLNIFIPNVFPVQTVGSHSTVLWVKGSGKGRAGHNRGKRQAEDIEKSDLHFLNKFTDFPG